MNDTGRTLVWIATIVTGLFILLWIVYTTAKVAGYGWCKGKQNFELDQTTKQERVNGHETRKR